jgi:hypothetical protein
MGPIVSSAAPINNRIVTLAGNVIRVWSFIGPPTRTTALLEFAPVCDFLVDRTMRGRADQFNDGEMKRRAIRGNGISLKP